MLYSHPEYESMEPEHRPSLDHVHTIATNDLEAQEHILRYQLPVAVERFDIGLVVLDSVAANFRAEHETRTPAGLAERAAELGKLGAMLRRVAVEHQASIVVTNQVSDRFDDPKSLPRYPSTAASSSPASTVPNMPAAVAEVRREVQSLDYQQQFFTGWGDERQGKRGQDKNPALGLAWANQISARIVLKMDGERQEYGGGNIWRDRKKSRTFAVVFAPWAPSTHPPVSYEIGMHGIVSVAPAVEPAATQTVLEEEEEHADLLNEELWATDDDEFP
jgi:DNA repair protein RAD57